MTESILKYVPFETVVNPSFWYKLTEIKLDVDKLQENRKHIWASYTNKQTEPYLPLLEIDSVSYNSVFHHAYCIPAHGYILNKNTVEQFKECNKIDLIDEEGLHILENIKSGRVLEDPTLLNTFFLLSFADLKKYHFYFWFAFPVPSNLNVFVNEDPKPISEVFNNDQVSNLMAAYNNIKDINQKSFFIVQRDTNNKIVILTLSTIRNLASLDTNIFNSNEVFFGFADPSSDKSHPGWPLRNYLACILYYCPKLQGCSINILALRYTFKPDICSCSNSIVFNVKLPKLSEDDLESVLFSRAQTEQSRWIGWQKNERGKFGPKLADLSQTLDPLKITENSVNLNLKLMKWRLVPDINLDIIQQTKCLVLGCGTLGCSVARSLLAWGFRNISFIDSGKVSPSNPIRQSLYTYEDSLTGREFKALAAARNMKKIFPLASCTGYVFNIPMPGHTVGDSLLEETKDSVKQLTKLIQEHDIMFLLMDSRESRWLPTVLGASYEKVVINAALGFDTYLVMRHGAASSRIVETPPDVGDLKVIAGNQLGCYFCNDITAPGNSLKDRTLDQQCTVTRPGVSPIAGALAVELAVSILQHKDGVLAPAFYKSAGGCGDVDAPNECILGLLPHSIRGFLSSFSHVLPATRKFQNCVACSQIVLDEYKKNGFDFLLKVFNSSKYLEDLTGLTEIHKESAVATIWEMEDSEVDEEE